MVSFRISGNPTIYGLIALSAMEIVASQKPGSPLAILQQSTTASDASKVAVSPPQTSPSQQGSSAHFKTPPIPLADQATSSAEPNFSSTATPSNAEIQTGSPARATSFRDLQSHWSQPFVELLAARGIISGHVDGTFKPDRHIQAAHFSMMLHQAKLYRFKVLQRELGMVISSSDSVFPTSVEVGLQASVNYSAAATEAEQLIRTHDIRTRAQAAVFIYRNLKDPLGSQLLASESWETQATPVSIDWHNSEPTFSEAETEQESPGLSETLEWSTVELDWVARG